MPHIFHSRSNVVKILKNDKTFESVFFLVQAFSMHLLRKAYAKLMHLNIMDFISFIITCTYLLMLDNFYLQLPTSAKHFQLLSG